MGIFTAIWEFLCRNAGIIALFLVANHLGIICDRLGRINHTLITRGGFKCKCQK